MFLRVLARKCIEMGNYFVKIRLHRSLGTEYLWVNMIKGEFMVQGFSYVVTRRAF